MQKIYAEENQYFTGCFLSKEETDGRLIAVNEKFLAMSWINKGQIIIVNSLEPKQIQSNSPYLQRNNSEILDLEFSPFNNNILASGNSDNSVLLWNIPKEGITKNITDSNSIYNKHANKVNFINFNPVASDVICSSTNDGEIHIWSVEKRNNFIEFKTDSPTIVSWNQNGNLIGATTKNNNINIFDPRNKTISFKKKISDSFRKSKFVFNDDNLFTTISWLKDGDYKFLYLWDIRKLDKEVDSIIIDTSANICTPFVDRELKLIYTVGKDESKIRMFDYSEQKFKKLSTFNSKISSAYSVFFNRKCLDNKKIEIGRFARYSKDNNSIYYASFMINNEKEFSEHLLSKNHFENSLINFDDWIHKKDNLIKELSERKKKFEELEQSFKLKKSSENLIKNQKKRRYNHQSIRPKNRPIKIK